MLRSLALLAQGTVRTEFHFARVEDPIDWLPPLAVFAALAALVVVFYRRDGVELPRRVTWLLAGLRTVALLGLLVVYLQPEWRNETDRVRNSRVLLLVDTSLSMGLTDGEVARDGGSVARSRSQEVIETLAAGPLLDELRQRHDTVIARFDAEVGRIAAAPKLAPAADAARQANTEAETSTPRAARMLFYGGVAALTLALILASIHVVLAHWSWLAAGAAPLVAAAVCFSLLAARHREVDWLRMMGLENRLDRTSLARSDAPDAEQSAASAWNVAWDEELAPRGLETRLGQAVRRLVSDEGSAPVSGIVVFTDGRQNAGLDAAAAAGAASEAKIPVYPVGLGSDQQPVNVRVSDFVVPARAFPGDAYTAAGYLQAQGLGAQSVTVELLSRDGAAATDDETAWRTEAAREVVLGADGEVTPVKFEITPDEVGRRTLRIAVRAPEADHNPADDAQEVDVEIVDRQTRVLLAAGGPTREYTFLRNQLHRDKSMLVDVLLQTAQEGVSQDADAILDDAPTTREEMFAYDCLVAFDPDWRLFSQRQLELIEEWIADQSGGMIAVAGAIHTDSWSQDAAAETMRKLYPVEFQRRFSLASDSRYGAVEPWPIAFSREGLEAEFLWLDDSAAASQQAWAAFPGVYGHYDVRGPKPGATVYGRFSDPRAAGGQGQPVYMADQFYGAGRVFYLGSGEMWRLRAEDEAYFERFYTKLIRHVSQGRLLRGSPRGVLLVERERYHLGASVVVRAQLNNAQLLPLEAQQVTIDAVAPDGGSRPVALTADPRHAGAFQGQFVVRHEGVYRLQLEIPESDQWLTRRIQVRVPDLERENPSRNDALLSEIARATGGRYYVGAASLAGGEGAEPLVDVLADRSRTITLPATPRKLWDNWWFLGGITGVLCWEWLLRRLARLA